MSTITEKERTEFEIKAPFSRSMEIQLGEIDKRAQNPLPTPKLGDTVGWLANADRISERDTYVGIVIGVLEAGLLRLHICSEIRNRDADGALYVAHPSLANKNRQKIGDAGVWFYLETLDDPGFKPPKEHYKLFNDDINLKRRGVFQAEKKRQVEAAERAKLEELQKQGTAA
jgi:hypothetical protein